MDKRVTDTYLGLPTIQRHNYDQKEYKSEIDDYVRGAIKFLMDWLDNYYYRDQIHKVLDVGCADGTAMWHFKKEYGMDAYGFDKYPIVQNKIDELKQLVTAGDFYELSKHYEQEFDMIFLNHTLEHADSVYKLIWECSKVLKRHGILFIAVPDGRTPWAWSQLESTTHFSCIVPEFLDTCLKRYGFETIITTKTYRNFVDGTPKRELWVIGIKQTELKDL